MLTSRILEKQYNVFLLTIVGKYQFINEIDYHLHDI